MAFLSVHPYFVAFFVTFYVLGSAHTTKALLVKFTTCVTVCMQKDHICILKIL